MENEITPAIHVDGLTLTFQKACVAAVLLGTVEHLLRSLHESGYEHMTEMVIHFVADDCAALWGVSNPERKHCFHCGRKQSAGMLCECIEGVLPRDFVDLNDEQAVAAQPADAPARTFLCSGCGQLSATSCGEVAKAQARTGVFYPRKHCWRCHSAEKGAANRQHRENYEKRVARAKKPAAKTRPVVKLTEKPTLRASLEEQLRAAAERLGAPVAQA